MSRGRRALVDPDVVAEYIRGGVTPRFMQRLMDIESAVRDHRRRLGFLYEDMRAADAHQRVFADRWRAVAERWRFDDVNELIAQHNDYYPIERNLPIDLRSGDYITVSGRSYRREPLGPAWVLEHFPPVEL